MGKTKRNAKPGHPGKENALTPLEILEVGRLFLRGWSQSRIGERFGRAQQTISECIARHLKPAWQEQAAADLFGHGTESIRWVPVHDDLTVDTEALLRLIEQDRRDGGRPFLLIGGDGQQHDDDR